MLGNFSYCNPTKLYFGDDSLKYLNAELPKYGKNVVLIYGGGSIKKNGIYDDVVKILEANGKNTAEIAGVMPNPTVEKLYEGVEIARSHKADLLLAVGGGSVCDYAKAVNEDYRIREFLRNKLKSAAVPRIFIERAGQRIRVKIYTARPGVVIGQKGAALEALKNDLMKFLGKEVLVDIQEIKKPDLVAFLVAESVALQLERRISFRRAIKKAITTCMALGAEGIKIQCSGRLGGAEIARTEWQRKGRIPLHTLRENIDYGFTEANTVYGKIGVKCWLCLKPEDNI